MTRVLLDPTSGGDATDRRLAPRLSTLQGRKVALLDISKPRGGVFLDRLEQRLREQAIEVVRYRKASYARVAERDLRAEIAANCDAVIEALAD